MVDGDFAGGYGRITSGADPNALLDGTIAFIENQLPSWRDDPARQPEDAEEKLNAQLCKWLNVVASQSWPLVHFSHEERQEKGRKVDIGAAPTNASFVGTFWHTIYEPFFVIEGKRLPTPPPASRKREYVSGGNDMTGGIQRFKVSAHGGEVTSAAIVGYLQDGAPSHWFGKVNAWIEELTNEAGADGCDWSADDKLTGLRLDSQTKTATSISRHARKGKARSTTIDLHHFWVSM